MAEATPPAAGTPVVLHVYDLGTSPGIQNINKVTYAIGGGLYHTAVEVYGKEYSFGCVCTALSSSRSRPSTVFRGFSLLAASR